MADEVAGASPRDEECDELKAEIDELREALAAKDAELAEAREARGWAAERAAPLPKPKGGVSLGKVDACEMELDMRMVQVLVDQALAASDQLEDAYVERGRAGGLRHRDDAARFLAVVRRKLDEVQRKLDQVRSLPREVHAAHEFAKLAHNIMAELVHHNRVNLPWIKKRVAASEEAAKVQLSTTAIYDLWKIAKSFAARVDWVPNQEDLVYDPTNGGKKKTRKASGLAKKAKKRAKKDEAAERKEPEAG
ncbi:hypothetical protein JL722_2990 [Aureococcus anophagefferens]|nr:hypothetical protein JL722_2990 [Aureococcus anophagefferens]